MDKPRREQPFCMEHIGGISQSPEKNTYNHWSYLPTFRVHPAIIAQASATVASMLPGRFNLGVGSGENLSEHILGDEWPPTPTRLNMLVEAVDIIRTLWNGEDGIQDYDGCYYNVENAKIYTKPEKLPLIFIAAEGEIACKLAGKQDDGLIARSGKEKITKKFKQNGGEGKPCYREATVCWAKQSKKQKTSIRNLANKSQYGTVKCRSSNSFAL